MKQISSEYAKTIPRRVLGEKYPTKKNWRKISRKIKTWQIHAAKAKVDENYPAL